MEFHTWAAFAAIWSVALIGIGANSVVCMTAGATNGFVRGVWTAFGITTASFVHSMIAAFGFSAIMLAWAGAYTAMKWIAVAYLVYLGIRLWLKKPMEAGHTRPSQEGRLALFRRGLLVSLTNPQAFLYYLVFFTPFITPERPLIPQLIVIVPTAASLAFIAYSLYVMMGSPIRVLLTSARRQLMLNRVSGSFFVLSGLVLATANTRR